jgi:hypothetical protein
MVFYRRHATRFRHTGWAQFWAHSARFFDRSVQKPEEKRAKATVFQAAAFDPKYSPPQRRKSSLAEPAI